MKFIKQLSSSVLGAVIGLFIYYFVTGEKIDWMLVGLLAGTNLIVAVIVTIIANGKLGNKLKSKNK
ncbi:hypothetical protein [Cytobacillus sp.]|uniref:hypothetical protein n=1 Tax=Cytobacillus sp. TaxID=2675269 RepID=UPI0028BECC70|nr:hypothetical protein [Cytobacillus sp.]